MGCVDDAIAGIEKGLSISKHPTMERDLETLRIIAQSKVFTYEFSIVQDPTNFALAKDFFTRMQKQSKLDTERVKTKTRGNSGENMATKRYSIADIESVNEFPIFAEEDWIAYRSVMYFYLKDYSSSLSVIYYCF